MPKGVFTRNKRPAVERFWPKVKIRGSDDCWLWRGRGHPYAYFWDGERQRGAHQFSLEIKLGRRLIPGECALHTCDTPKCVNPNHLFVGTNADNSRDMVLKGRKEKGSSVKTAKLDERTVLEIRKRWDRTREPFQAIGDDYSVCGHSIYLIVIGKIWKHVGGPVDKLTGRKNRISKKLSEDQKNLIRKLYKTGKHTMKSLGLKFGVCGPLIHRIIHSGK